MDSNEERARFLFETFGLNCVKFTKEELRAQKTPDFRVCQEADFCFFCEVKGVVGDNWLEKMMVGVPPETFVLETRADPAFNRLTDDIHEAYKQFESVNPEHMHPNVLVFVNNPNSLCEF